MSNRTRSLEELITIVGEKPRQYFLGAGIVDAYKEGRITAGEAKRLQSYSLLTPSAQKRRLKRARAATGEEREKLRAKLNDGMDRFYGLHPELKDPRGE